jgi:hypothetical protein
MYVCVSFCVCPSVYLHLIFYGYEAYEISLLSVSLSST